MCHTHVSLYHIKTFIINTVSLWHVSALKGPSSGSKWPFEGWNMAEWHSVNKVVWIMNICVCVCVCVCVCARAYKLKFPCKFVGLETIKTPIKCQPHFAPMQVWRKIPCYEVFWSTTTTLKIPPLIVFHKYCCSVRVWLRIIEDVHCCKTVEWDSTLKCYLTIDYVSGRLGLPIHQN
jgi:hypothetical protein